MSASPTSVAQEPFEGSIVPYLSTAHRGYVRKIPLYKICNDVLYRLPIGCQWPEVPLDAADESTWWAVYHHFRKWSRDGSLARVVQQRVVQIRDQVDTHHLKLDGRPALAREKR